MHRDVSGGGGVGGRGSGLGGARLDVLYLLPVTMLHRRTVLQFGSAAFFAFPSGAVPLGHGTLSTDGAEAARTALGGELAAAAATGTSAWPTAAMTDVERRRAVGAPRPTA